MNDDAALLRSYAKEGSQAAFTEVVRRHVDLVYGTALRRTSGDSHRAADVAQQVFTALARDAGKLWRHPVLSAWLHTATRNAALNLMISEQRRQARESEAASLGSTAATSTTSPDWDQLRPLLDSAIDELPATERAAVILRFLERRPFAQIGTALKLSEDAARMRTDRALDKLRLGLARRGITSTSAALGAIVVGQPLNSAPAGLAATLATQSLAAAGSGTLAASFILMSSKFIITAALCGLIGFGIGSYSHRSRPPEIVTPLPNNPAALDRTLATLRNDNQRLQSQVNDLNADVAHLTDANSQLTKKQAEASIAVPRQGLTIGLARWEVQQMTLTNLRQIDAARSQYHLEKNSSASSVAELVGRKSYIKTLRTVDGEDYSSLSMNPGDPLTVTTPDGIVVTYDPSGRETTQPDIPPEVARVQQLGPQIQATVGPAVTAYRAAHDGANPPNEQALIPYFATPKEGADFVEFMEAKKAAGM